MNRIRTESGRTAKILMIIGSVVIMSMMLSGCGASKYLPVSKKKYEAAVTDMESAKIEFEKSQMMREAVEQENEQLRTENEKVSVDLEVMTSEIQRIKDGQESERELLSVREAEISVREAEMLKEGQILRARVGKLHQEYQKLESQNRALKDTVRRYQKDLKKARQAKVKQAAKVPEDVSAKSSLGATKPVAVSKPKPTSKPIPVVAPVKSSLAPVNINTATANDLVLSLGLTKNMAKKVIANRPYRLRGELVAKKVVPKAMFAVIKDKITAAPK